MLFGSTGRTDLLGSMHTRALARDQYRSVRRLARYLPSAAQVYPTHGFGSFCAATPTNGDGSTVAEQRRVNPALTLCEAAYIDALMAGLGPYPTYYAHMGGLNADGPPAWSPLAPTPVAADELRRRVAAGCWVVDLRKRRAFAAGHLVGTLGVELSNDFVAYLGWLVPWGTPLTLLGESPVQVAEAQAELARIEVDRLAGAAIVDGRLLDGPAATRSYRVADFPALAAALLGASGGCPPVHVLDVRRCDERASGHVTGSQNIPVHELAGRTAEIGAGQVWIHCASGYRASIAASILDGAGRDVVLVDDSFSSAASAGVPVTIP